MVGHSLGSDPNEFYGISRDSIISGRRCRFAEHGRPADELAATRAIDHDFFLSGMLDGFVWSGDGIVYVYLAGADFGLGSFGRRPGSQTLMEPADSLVQSCLICLLSNHLLVSRECSDAVFGHTSLGRDRPVVGLGGGQRSKVVPELGRVPRADGISACPSRLTLDSQPRWMARLFLE